MNIDEIKEKVNDGKIGELRLEDLAEIAKPASGQDMWPFLLAALMIGFGGSGSADYWRGKHDAYKELTTKKANADG